jgi:hypothetical protein
MFGGSCENIANMNRTDGKSDLMLLKINRVIANANSPRISPKIQWKQKKYEQSKKTILDKRGSAISARPPRVQKLTSSSKPPKQHNFIPGVPIPSGKRGKSKNKQS